MPRKILATVIETWCCHCGKVINIRLESGEIQHIVACWNCDSKIKVNNGYGINNVSVTCENKRIRYNIIWQEKV